MKNFRLQLATRSVAKSRGLTLVELMVSLVLGLLIVSGMLTLLARNSETRGEIEKAGRQIENGRFAVQRLTEDIHHAGFYGEYYELPAGTALPDPCATDPATLKTAMSFPIQARTAATTTCVGAADIVAGTNVLVLRFASPVATLPEAPTITDTSIAAALTPGVVYIQPYVEGVNVVTGASGLTLTSPFSGRVRGAGGGFVPAPIYRYITRLYFISPCSRRPCTAASDDGAPIPTLKMVELGATGGATAFTAPIAVAEGIERLELDYGLDTKVAPSPGLGSADSYVSCAPCTVAQWANVVSVRINLLARNAERSAGFADTKVYAMGLTGNVTAPSGSTAFKRHLFQVIARVNNQSMRREQ
jgi:type IV pilus assembly protein PilW